MCGIVGYVGKKEALPLLIEGLKRESYRGYDSSGVAVFNGEEIVATKAVGKLEKLEEKLGNSEIKGGIGIGHSRWATHGQVTEENAHPHSDCKKNIFVVHNGIIENFEQLKKKLQKEGHTFNSETDTEVLSHLIEKFFAGSLEDAVREALLHVKGTYGLVVIAKDDPGKIVAARLSSPLVLAVNDSGGFVASDPAALILHSNKMVFLDDYEIATIKADGFTVTDLQNNKKEKKVTKLDWTVEEAQKGGYDHFMLKEIMEQPESIENALRGRVVVKEGRVRLGGLEKIEVQLQKVERLNILACGTAYYAGMVGKYMMEEYTGIPTEVDVASEFRYRKPIIDKKIASLFISQSGETADTLGALQEVKRKKGLSLGIINVVGSSVAREIDAGVYNHAGPEIGVASTKAFTSQLTVLALLTIYLGRQRGMSQAVGQKITKGLLGIPKLVAQVLEKKDEIKRVAEKYKDAQNFLYLGRKYNYPIALEGALKLKEISYAHAEAYPAGEMKHGPIALIDENFPTVVLALTDSVYEKMMSNIQQIKARKGPVIAVATKGNKEIAEVVDDVFYIPKTLEMLTPILSVIPLQLFAYYIAVARGLDPDKPRNLAKSVTVE